MAERATVWEDAGHGFSFKHLQNCGPARHILGLDGANPIELTAEERLRLAGILVKACAISSEELQSLGMKIIEAE